MLRAPNEGSGACCDPFLTSHLRSNQFAGRFSSTRKSLSAMIVADSLLSRFSLRVPEYR